MLSPPALFQDFATRYRTVPSGREAERVRATLVQSSRLAGAVVRLMLAGFAFFLCLLSFEGKANAAPSGMCSTEAQSIAAPPPMFPADDAILKGCDDERDFSFTQSSGGTPSDRLAPLDPQQDYECVLDASVPYPPASDIRCPREGRIVVSFAEHRWQGLRPPRL